MAANASHRPTTAAEQVRQCFSGSLVFGRVLEMRSDFRRPLTSFESPGACRSARSDTGGYTLPPSIRNDRTFARAASYAAMTASISSSAAAERSLLTRPEIEAEL